MTRRRILAALSALLVVVGACGSSASSSPPSTVDPGVSSLLDRLAADATDPSTPTPPAPAGPTTTQPLLPAPAQLDAATVQRWEELPTVNRRLWCQAVRGWAQLRKIKADAPWTDPKDPATLYVLCTRAGL